MNKQYHRVGIRRTQSAISVFFKDETQTDPFWKDHEFQWYVPCNTGEDESVGWKCIHRPESLTQSDFYTIADIIQCYSFSDIIRNFASNSQTFFKIG